MENEKDYLLQEIHQHEREAKKSRLELEDLRNEYMKLRNFLCVVRDELPSGRILGATNSTLETSMNIIQKFK